MKEAERRLGETDSVLVSEQEYLRHPRELEPFGFRLGPESAYTRQKLHQGFWRFSKNKTFRLKF